MHNFKSYSSFITQWVAQMSIVKYNFGSNAYKRKKKTFILLIVVI